LKAALSDACFGLLQGIRYAITIFVNTLVEHINFAITINIHTNGGHWRRTFVS